jgi:hypothetical protein
VAHCPAVGHLRTHLDVGGRVAAESSPRCGSRTGCDAAARAGSAPAMHQHAGAMNAKRILVSAALLCAPSFACGGPGGLPRFNEATIETVSGYVSEVDPFQRLERNTRNGVKATLDTDDSERIDVYLGPATFLDHHGFLIERGDYLAVTGSKVRHDGEDVIIATVISEDGQRLTIRDAKGHQAWRGFKRDHD